MRKEKALIDLLRGLVNLLVEESERNPEFAAKIESLFAEIPERKAHRTRSTVKLPHGPLPDIYAERNARDETEFRLWLSYQSIPILREIVRVQDFDPTRRTTKWREAEKLAGFIVDSLNARLSRGNAFSSKGLTERTELVESTIENADERSDSGN